MTICPNCQIEIEVGEWPFCPHGSTHSREASVHYTERAVVWENPLNGKLAYPPRNDVPMPARYERGGFVRREFESLKSLESFEKRTGVRNEKAWFDGSGRGAEDCAR